MENYQEFKFDELLKKLESIVEKLESGEVSLEESVKLYSEGMELSLELKKRLEEAKQVITIKNE